jgi:hypothetical protein
MIPCHYFLFHKNSFKIINTSYKAIDNYFSLPKILKINKIVELILEIIKKIAFVIYLTVNSFVNFHF